MSTLRRPRRHRRHTRSGGTPISGALTIAAGSEQLDEAGTQTDHVRRGRSRECDARGDDLGAALGDTARRGKKRRRAEPDHDDLVLLGLDRRAGRRRINQPDGHRAGAGRSTRRDNAELHHDVARGQLAPFAHARRPRRPTSPRSWHRALASPSLASVVPGEARSAYIRVERRTSWEMSAPRTVSEGVSTGSAGRTRLPERPVGRVLDAAVSQPDATSCTACRRGRLRHGTPMSAWWARCQPVWYGAMQEAGQAALADHVGRAPGDRPSAPCLRARRSPATGWRTSTASPRSRSTPTFISGRCQAMALPLPPPLRSLVCCDRAHRRLPPRVRAPSCEPCAALIGQAASATARGAGARGQVDADLALGADERRGAGPRRGTLDGCLGGAPGQSISIVFMASSRVPGSGFVREPCRGPVTASVSPAIPEAAGQVVVDQADALHERVDDRRADEPEAARAAGRPTARRTPASWPGSRRRRASAGSRAGGGGTIVARYASNEPNSAAVASERRRVADGGVDLGAVADDPGVGHQPLPIVRRRTRPRPPDRSRGTPRGRPRACGGSSTTTGPAWNDSSASRSNSSTSSWHGHAPLVVVVARPSARSGRGRSAPAHQQRGRGSIDRRRQASRHQGIGAVRRACSASSGRPPAARR